MSSRERGIFKYGCPSFTGRREARGTNIEPEPKLLDAKLIGSDREMDIAVIKIERTGLTHLALGDSDAVRQGELVLAFGNPLGLEGSVSMGIVSSITRELHPDDMLAYIQTDAPINPGNSGGPLINSEGRVIGINTFILTQSGGSEGLGFAIPSNIVNTVYTQLRKEGHVHRGRIGISVSDHHAGHSRRFAIVARLGCGSERRAAGRTRR